MKPPKNTKLSDKNIEIEMDEVYGSMGIVKYEANGWCQGIETIRNVADARKMIKMCNQYIKWKKGSKK